jgi:hypothetical protein
MPAGSVPASRHARRRPGEDPGDSVCEATKSKPVNLNFFAHKTPVPNNERENAWRERLKPYYVELGVDPAAPVPVTNRLPFDAAMCALVEELKPDVVSFHYGLPTRNLSKGYASPARA